MADESSGSKTEKATPRRLQDSRRKGQVSKSEELASSLSFLAGIACVMVMLGFSSRELAHYFLAVERSFESLSTSTMHALVLESLFLLAKLSVLPLVAAALVHTAVLWMQVGPVFSFDPVQPKMERLNPAQGLKRLFSMRSVVTCGLMTIKSAVVAGAITIVCLKVLPDAIRVIHADLGAALEVADTALQHLLLWCGGAFVALGFADLAYQRWQFLKDQRMTIQEVRRELRDDEGDPLVKAARMGLSREGTATDHLGFMHIASLVIRDRDNKLMVYVYRPKQFTNPLFLLRSPGGALSQQVLALANTGGVKVVLDDGLVKTHFPVGSIGYQLAAHHAAPLLRHLGAQPS
jgi:flagellar biosynthesis protein FlhB